MKLYYDLPGLEAGRLRLNAAGRRAGAAADELMRASGGLEAGLLQDGEVYAAVRRLRQRCAASCEKLHLLEDALGKIMACYAGADGRALSRTQDIMLLRRLDAWLAQLPAPGGEKPAAPQE